MSYGLIFLLLLILVPFFRDAVLFVLFFLTASVLVLVGGIVFNALLVKPRKKPISPKRPRIEPSEFEPENDAEDAEFREEK